MNAKPKSIYDRAEYAAKRRKLVRNSVEWDWFTHGFVKGVRAVQRQRARFCKP